MPSRELQTLRRQVEDLRQRNAQLEAQWAHHQQADQGLFRFLFDTMDEGFCVIEFFDGPHGPLSDYVHVLANAAYARHAGIADVTGQKLREMVPDEADDWIARHGEVLVGAYLFVYDITRRVNEQQKLLEAEKAGAVHHRLRCKGRVARTSPATRNLRADQTLYARGAGRTGGAIAINDKESHR